MIPGVASLERGRGLEKVRVRAEMGEAKARTNERQLPMNCRLGGILPLRRSTCRLTLGKWLVLGEVPSKTWGCPQW